MRHLHPVSPLLDGAIGLLRAWPIVLLALARANLAIIAVFAAVLLTWRTLSWLRTTWGIGDEGLVVRSGIMWRNVQTVPPQRVQQVELRQALRHRVAGVAAVRVGLAGGGDANQVDLDALSVEDAEQLRGVLEQWRIGHRSVERSSSPGGQTVAQTVDPVQPASTVPAGESGATVFAVETWQLVVAGLTSRSLWLAPFAALAALIQFLSDARIGDDATDAIQSQLAAVSPAVTIIVVMGIALVVAAVSTIVTNYGLEVRQLGDDVSVRRGLLEQRSAVVPRRRVQSVEIGTNLMRQRFGLASLDVRTADLGGSADSGSTSLPIGRREELEHLLAVLLPAVEQPVSLARHPPAAVRREILRRVRRLVVVAALLALATAGFDGRAIGGAVAVAVVAAVVTGWIAGRRLRSGWTSTAIVTERGAVVRRRWVVPVSRIQSVSILRDPFQRRLGLASVRLDVAGTPRGVVLRDLEVGAAHQAVALARGR